MANRYHKCKQKRRLLITQVICFHLTKAAHKGVCFVGIVTFKNTLYYIITNYHGGQLNPTNFTLYFFHVCNRLCV